MTRSRPLFRTIVASVAAAAALSGAAVASADGGPASPPETAPAPPVAAPPEVPAETAPPVVACAFRTLTPCPLLRGVLRPHGTGLEVDVAARTVTIEPRAFEGTGARARRAVRRHLGGDLVVTLTPRTRAFLVDEEGRERVTPARLLAEADDQITPELRVIGRLAPGAFLDDAAPAMTASTVVLTIEDEEEDED